MNENLRSKRKIKKKEFESLGLRELNNKIELE